jgi:ubiquinone/menaquinone biosynthesis C-methylase UbiE
MPWLTDIVRSIPLSGTDASVRERGFDMLTEYGQIIEASGFDSAVPLLEVATGPGRAAALLSRMGFRLITGDISLEKNADVRRRLPTGNPGDVLMLALDMERLPFRDASVRSILCLNTVHELKRPHACLDELTRVIHPEGILTIGDFNELGFGLMQEIHREVHGDDHWREPTDLSELMPVLKERFASVRRVDTPMNTSWVCTARRT